MKVLDILVENADGSVQVVTEFSADELQRLLQLAINVTASVGLTAYRDSQMTDENGEPNELND